MKLSRAKVTPFIILIIMSVIAYAVAVYNTLTHGQTWIHPDTVVATLLAREQVKAHAILPSDWCYANGELWVLDQNLLALLFTYTVKNQALARMLASVLFYSSSCIGMIYISRHTYKNNMWALYVSVFLMSLLGTQQMILWEAAYAYHPLFTALLLAWGYDWYKSKNIFNKAVIPFTIFAIIICLPGMRNIAEIIIPVAGAFVIVDFFKLIDKSRSVDEKKSLFKICSIRVGTMAAMSILGFVIYNILCIGRVVNGGDRNGFQFVGKLVELKGHSATYLHNIFMMFGADLTIDTHGIVANYRWDEQTIVGFILCLLICFILPLLQLIFIKKSDEATKFTWAYMLVHNVIIMLVSIPFYGRLEERYMLTTVMADMFVSLNFVTNVIGKFWQSESGVKRLASCVIVVACVLFIGYDTKINFNQTKGWKEEREAYRDVVKELQAEGLYYGYAMWKYAYTYSIHSDFAISLYNVQYEDYGFEPFYYVCNKHWYDPVDREVFLMCDESDKDVIEENHLLDNVDANVLREFYLGDTGFYIYVLDNNDIFTYRLE